MNTQTISIGADDLIQIEQVGGDLEVQGSDGAELQARGDQVRIERRNGSVAISCAGDLALSVPRNAHISASTIGGDARLENLSGTVELGLVAGDALLRNLTGSVQLNGIVGGDTHMEHVAQVSMNSGNRGPAFDFGETIRRKVEQATRRADAKVKRAERKAAHYIQMEARHIGSAHWNATPESADSAAPREAVSDEERMKILKMLQDKKITSEQAEKLLSALEGSA